MATIDFTVGFPSGAPNGIVDGEHGPISSYLALNPTGYSLQNDIIFCINPDILIAHGQSSYTVLNGIQDGFTTAQVNALEGLFSHYIDGGNTSFTTQEEVMIADWKIVDPGVHISGVSSAIVGVANHLVMEATTGGYTIDPNLDFITLVNDNGGQSFINISEVPVPASLGLFLSAIVLLTAYGFRKKLSFRRVAD